MSASSSSSGAPFASAWTSSSSGAASSSAVMPALSSSSAAASSSSAAAAQGAVPSLAKMKVPELKAALKANNVKGAGRRDLRKPEYIKLIQACKSKGVLVSSCPKCTFGDLTWNLQMKDLDSKKFDCSDVECLGHYNRATGGWKNCKGPTTKEDRKELKTRKWDASVETDGEKRKRKVAQVDNEKNARVQQNKAKRARYDYDGFGYGPVRLQDEYDIDTYMDNAWEEMAQYHAMNPPAKNDPQAKK